MVQEVIDTYFENLRNDVSRRYGQRIETSTDFLKLSLAIVESKSGYISPSTLKRLWGYVKDTYSSKRSSTLDTLARYVGYNNYQAYIAALSTADPNSSAYTSAMTLDVSKLSVGHKLTITWHPNRRLCVTYIGNLTFSIDEAENSKLKKGMHIRCLTLIKGQPLILNIVSQCHDKENSLTYIAGKVNGIDWSIY